jgi:Chlorovirus glycoprotein repeat
MTIKISQLGTLSALAGNTLIPVVESTGTGFTSKKIQASTLRNFFANLATGGDSANLRINSDLIPSAAGTYNLGSAGSPYAEFYLSGTLNSTGVIQNTSNIQSQSTTTGALVVQGGVGVTGNINAQSVAATSLTGTLTTPNQPNITGVGVITSGTWQGMSITNTYLANSSLTINGTSVSLGGSATVTANAATLTGTALNSTVVASSLTSVGNLTSLSARGAITTTGNISAAYFIGDGSQLTNVPASALIGTASSIAVSGNITAGNVSATRLTGTLTTASQTNITAVGNIVTGTWSATPIQNAYLANSSITINGAAVSLGGSVVIDTSATGLTGNTLNSNIANSNLTSVGTLTSLTVSGNITAGNVSATNLTGALTTAAQPNITSMGNLTALSASGNIITTGNVIAAKFYGDGSQLTGLPANYGNTQVAAYLPTYAGNIGGTVTTTAQPRITSVGNLTALSASGNISTTGNVVAAKFYGDGSALTGVVATGIGNLSSITVGNIINANTNGVGNIGTSTNSFNTIFARATSAQYADIAECYLADAAYTPGTVLEFGGKFEVTESTDESQRIAGVVSTSPAYVMNDQLQGQHVVQVALLGRVPCRVRGKIFKGDFMVAGGSGYARPTAYPKFGTVIGKALEDFDGVDGVIEIVVGRL